MSAYTVTGSLTNFRKGSLDLFSAKPEHYAFSNIFDVAQRSDFFERVAVTKNIEYVTEVIKIQHDSPWFIAAHDEFALIMDGDVTLTFFTVPPQTLPAPASQGAHLLEAPPSGACMGNVQARRGHLVLLPANTAYRLGSDQPAVALIQTLSGDLTQERWADICARG